MVLFPSSPAIDDELEGPFGEWYRYDGEKWTLRVAGAGDGAAPEPVSVAFFFPGKPGTSDVVVVPIVTPLTIPANLAGSSVYALAAATADADFELWHRVAAGGAVSQIGTVTLQAGNSGAFMGAGADLAAGDALLLYAPTTADATLENVGITILAERA